MHGDVARHHVLEALPGAELPAPVALLLFLFLLLLQFLKVGLPPLLFLFLLLFLVLRLVLFVLPLFVLGDFVLLAVGTGVVFIVVFFEL